MLTKEAFGNRSIFQLPHSRYLNNILFKAGIRNITEFADLTEEELSGIRALSKLDAEKLWETKNSCLKLLATLPDASDTSAGSGEEETEEATFEPAINAHKADAEDMASCDGIQADSAEATSQPDGMIDQILENCLRRDTDRFLEFCRDNHLSYSVSQIGVYLRTVHVREISKHLQKTMGISYGEFLAINGILPAKPSSYWKDELLEYLRENFAETADGTLFDVNDSFQYDPIRNKVRILASVYDGFKRVPVLKIIEQYKGKLELRPCYREDNYAFDVELLSDGNSMGKLNQTLFRSRGLGVYVAQALYSKTATISNLRLTNEEYIEVLFEMRFCD